MKRTRWIKLSVVSVLSVLLFFIVRRAFLVILLGLKIFGHSDPMNAWKGPVVHTTLIRGGVPTDLYRTSGSFSPMLIVHGVNPTGKDSVDLVRISEALAQIGYEVYVPDLVEMRKVHLRPEEAQTIKAVFQTIGRDAGIACFSYGCGPALVSAADPDVRDHVRFAIAFGGYFDIREALEFVITGPENEYAYLKWIYLSANADLLDREEDRGRIREIAREKRIRFDETQSPDARALLEVFSAPTVADFRARLRTGPASLTKRLDALSPSRFVKDLRAPLVLIHGVNDPVIPAQQSIEFADAAAANGLSHTLTLLRMYGHVNPVLPEVRPGSLVSFYIPETFRFLRVVNELISRR